MQWLGCHMLCSGSNVNQRMPPSLGQNLDFKHPLAIPNSKEDQWTESQCQWPDDWPSLELLGPIKQVRPICERASLLSL